MDKTNYSVARVEIYTRVSLVKAERHNERKNESYSNMNVDLTQTPNNVHYKKCKNTYNERLKEMIDDGEPIEVNCHFCNTNYTFSIDELKEIAK